MIMMMTKYQFTPETPREFDAAMFRIAESLPKDWKLVGFQLNKKELATCILERGDMISQWQITGSAIGRWSLGSCDWIKIK